nr:vegetative cell wall protein gp1-like [Lolium perenne]
MSYVISFAQEHLLPRWATPARAHPASQPPLPPQRPTAAPHHAADPAPPSPALTLGPAAAGRTPSRSRSSPGPSGSRPPQHARTRPAWPPPAPTPRAAHDRAPRSASTPGICRSPPAPNARPCSLLLPRTPSSKPPHAVLLQLHGPASYARNPRPRLCSPSGRRPAHLRTHALPAPVRSPSSNPTHASSSRSGQPDLVLLVLIYQSPNFRGLILPISAPIDEFLKPISAQFIVFIKFVLTGTAGKNRAALPLRLHHHALAPPGSFRSPHAPASSRQTPPANSLPASRAKLRPPACLQLPRALPPGHHHPLHARSLAEPRTRPLLRWTPAQAPRALSRPWPSTPAASARHPTHCAPTRPPCAATQAATSTNHRRPAGARFSLARFRPLLHLVNPPASKSIRSRAAA